MALNGNLSEFSALETLQLIHLQKKSGSLLVSSGRKRYALHFREGALIGCQAAARGDGDPFLTALVGLGQLGQDDERRLRLLHAEGGTDPWTRVFETSTLDRETLEQTREMAIQGAIDRILLWNRGHFEFVNGPLPATTGESWSVEHLLLESMRRLDEAADLERGDFPLDAIPTRLSPSSTPTASERQEERIPPALERAFLAKADGKRSLRDLVHQLQVGEYDILAAARDLRARRLIRVEVRGQRSEGSQLLLEQPFHFRHPVFAVGIAAVTCATVLVGLWVHGATARVSGDWTRAQREIETATRGERAIRLALEMHRFRVGSFPLRIEELVERGLWPEAAREELAGFAYSPAADGDYRLTARSAGMPASTASTAPARSAK